MQNCTVKSPAINSCSKRKEKKNRRERTIRRRTKNTPFPTRRRHVPTAVASRLPNRANVCAIEVVHPEVNLGKASSCIRIHYPRQASGYLESPIITMYFAADVEAHFFSRFSFFFSRLSLSLSIFPLTHDDANDVSTGGTTTALSQFSHNVIFHTIVKIFK